MIDRVYIVFCLFILMFCRCADDASFENEQSPKEGILVKLTNGSLASTKTALSSSANLHHVEKVYAFLYQGDTTDMTKARYVLHEDLNWSPKDSSDYKVDAVQAKEFLLKNSLNLPSGNYTLLCVGLDDRSGGTYDLPTALIGKSLSEAKAVLAAGKKQDDIAHSELFAGWETFEYVRGGLSEVAIEMRRRVAGVLCYLKDIPYVLTEGSNTYRITRVCLRLFADQNSSVSLLRPKSKDEVVADFGNLPLVNSDVILSSEDFVAQKYKRQDGKDLYAIPATTTRLANTILMGAYLLPIENQNGNGNTLLVEVLGKETSGTSDDPDANAPEVVVKSFPAVWEEAGNPDERLRYSIRPNFIYHIGQKSSQENTDGDHPESLAGTRLDLGVKPWTKEEVDVEFPGVPINPMIALENASGGVYDEERYIFDCMGTKTIRLRVIPSLMKDPWKVTIVDSKSQDMLFMQAADASSYVTEYTSDAKLETHIPIVLTDYVKPGGDDIRKVAIQVVSLNADGSEKTETRQTLIIQQYNAIIVGSGDRIRGFSRFNWGTVRSITTGDVTKDDATVDWGYFTSTPTYIFGSGIDGSKYDNGYTNYKEAKDGKAADDGFVGSAIQKCAQYKYTYDSKGIVEKEAGWYLPARDELKAFLTDPVVLEKKEEYHIKEEYWSSNSVTSSLRRSISFFWNTGNNSYEEDKNYREKTFYLRPACAMN